jgi:hypothetical protein
MSPPPSKSISVTIYDEGDFDRNESAGITDFIFLHLFIANYILNQFLFYISPILYNHGDANNLVKIAISPTNNLRRSILMKKLLVVGMVTMLATASLGVTAVDAAHRGHHGRHHDQYSETNYQLKEDSRFVLRRTNQVLRRAQEALRDQSGQRRSRRHRHHVGQNGLGYAISFQMKARDSYQQGLYQPAIDYSLRARAIALRIIRRVNRGQYGLPNGYDEFKNCDMDRNEIDSRESGYWDHRPNGSQLEIEVRGNEIDDDAAISFNLDFNF